MYVPTHNSRNFPIFTSVDGLESYRYAIVDTSPKKMSDEDLVKCMLRWTNAGRHI